jgi:hypothetical protein
MERGQLFVPPTNVRIVRKLRHLAAMLLAFQVIDVNLVTHTACLLTSGSLPGCRGRNACEKNLRP